jgi:hypothetical protein
MDEDFNEYMTFFKEQPLKEKQKIIYDQLKIISKFVDGLCDELGLSSDIYLDKELLNDNYTEEEYYESLIVLVNSIQDSVSNYSNGICDFLEKISDE